MDRKTLVLVAACLILIVFWWPIMDRVGLGRFNPAHRPRPAATAAAPETSTADTSRITAPPGRLTGAPGPGAGTPVNGATLSGLPLAATRAAIERTVSIVTPLYHATFSTRGARLLSVELLRYTAAHGASNLAVHGKFPRHGEIVPEGDRVVLAGAPTFGIDLGSGSSLVSLARKVASSPVSRKTVVNFRSGSPPASPATTLRAAASCACGGPPSPMTSSSPASWTRRAVRPSPSPRCRSGTHRSNGWPSMGAK